METKHSTADSKYENDTYYSIPVSQRTKRSGMEFYEKTLGSPKFIVSWSNLYKFYYCTAFFNRNECFPTNFPCDFFTIFSPMMNFIVIIHIIF